MKKNVAGQYICAQLVSATDGSAVTSGTTTVYVLGDGGTQGTGGGTVAHEGQGCWSYAPSQAETNYDHVAFTFVNTSAVSATVQTYPTFPQTGDSFARLGAPVGASISADVAGVQSDTNDIQTRIPAALVSGRIDASVGAMATDVLTSTALAASAVTEIQSGLSTLDAAGVRTAVGLASANLDTQLAALPTAAENADAVWDEALSGHLTAGSTGNALNAAGSAGDPWSTSIPGAYGAGSAGYIIGTYLDEAVSAVPTATENADALLKRDMSAVTGESARSPLNALRFLRNKWSISGTTLTVTKEDDATSAWSATVTATAGADPITGSDPA